MNYSNEYEILSDKDNHVPTESMTMERFGDGVDELVMAQTTSMCCALRRGCLRPSIHWVLNENVDNFTPDSTISSDYEHSLFAQTVGGWIHEESGFIQRCLIGECPGSRKTRFVQHAGLPPRNLMLHENKKLCVIQQQETSHLLSKDDIEKDVIAIHEKEMTLPLGFCCHQPYITSKDPISGRVFGETKYVCDHCIFVPKFHVVGNQGDIIYILRPDTCVGGICVRPRCGGTSSKCFRVPYLIRDPITLEPMSNIFDDNSRGAQVTFLWSGFTNEIILDRHAYHIGFPKNSASDEKIALIGAAILVDVVLYEKNDKDD